ncbi:MAG TPA: RNA-binding protein [Polyangiaceae bacterium]|jgi:RNA recognition motif-containing protein|nr:RNA-binding protein [Polyangiaceae bacterium]
MAIDDRCKLFVAGLPDSISEAVLRQLFEATGGTVVDVSVPRDRATGRPRGFGFVTLTTEDEARAARESLDGSMQSGRSISVRPFQAAPPKRPDGTPGPRSDAPPDRNAGPAEDRTLYLGNLPYDTSSVEVEQMLERAGVAQVVRVNLPLDPGGRPRGFGFVTLGSAEAAQGAVDALREAELKGRRVSASIAHARGERPARPPGGGPGRPMSPGGFAPRPSAPRWAPDEFRPPDAPPPLPGDESDDRKSGDRRRGPGPKDTKKKKGKPAERERTRRDGEGLRGPRARDKYGADDD